MTYTEVEGDLIKLALEGQFAVITHGCNCFNTMKSGIAKQMAQTFQCNEYIMERPNVRGNINKLGQIESNRFSLSKNKYITVINSYTQYKFGRDKQYLDYEALALCLRKINHTCHGQHIGLPKIGTGLAGGDWPTIRSIILNELPDCQVTVVIYDK